MCEAGTGTTACMWRSEDNLWDLVFSFQYVGPQGNLMKAISKVRFHLPRGLIRVKLTKSNLCK